MSVSVNHVSVSFPGVKALNDVSLHFEDGHIHGVLGANGSGKSTLVKVLTGIYHADKDSDASMEIAGQKVKDISTPNEAHDLGIRVVHQESPLIYSFSVAECIALFKGYPVNGMKINWKKVYSYCQNLLELYHIKVDPDTLTDDLSAADRNMIAMAMAMGDEIERESTKMLILDEADASIPEAETDTFLAHVRMIAEMGIPVLMVTHRMKEVMSHCDDISILNGGELVYHGQKSEVDETFIVSKMIRQQDDSVEKEGATTSRHHLTELWELLGRKTHEKNGKPALAMEDLVAKNLNGISFSVQPGEILGIIGNPDSGVRELPQILGGDMQIESGRFLVDGEELTGKLSPRICYKKGVNVLPCDRPVRGGIMSCTLRENVFMPNFIQFWNKPKLSRKTMDLCVDIFDVQPRNSNETLFGKFSGGNQQKAIMAKWLSTCPKVFVLDDPTYGVDPASRLRIFDAMREAAEQNVAMIVFSTEPEQLAGLCSRVIALHAGKIVSELREEDGMLDRTSIARWCYT